MNIKKIPNLIMAIALALAPFLAPVNAFAQTNDSTTLPWTSAGPAVAPIATTPSGTRCGAATWNSLWWDWNYSPCQGHHPLYSCPAGYYQKLMGEQDGVYYYSCINY